MSRPARVADREDVVMYEILRGTARPPRRAVAAAMLLLPVLLLAPSAPAQDALGSGDALDNNLRVGSGGFNAPRRVPDFRARNMLVTGNVPGGRGFRGTVGYTAPGDFRGLTGSDTLFRFRADSAFSSPNFIRYGQTAQRLRFGQDLGDLTFRREAAPTARQVALRQQELRGDNVSRRIRMDLLNQASSSAELIDSAARPRLIGVRQGDHLFF